MSVTVKVRKEFAEALEPFGDLQETVDAALRRYTIEKIGDKIASLRVEDKRWQEKFGYDYESFIEKTSNDPEFVELLHREHPTWELDLMEWKFCHEGVKDWSRELEQILTS